MGRPVKVADLPGVDTPLQSLAEGKISQRLNNSRKVKTAHQ
ncbi:MAG: hypothetical protein P8126_01730 [Gammaproteobacteria bacterium]|jgi:hypothetical protein